VKLVCSSAPAVVATRDAVINAGARRHVAAILSRKIINFAFDAKGYTGMASARLCLPLPRTRRIKAI
jgi:hypothetical protein